LNDEFLIDGIVESEKYYYLYSASNAVPNSSKVEFKRLQGEFFNKKTWKLDSNGVRQFFDLPPRDFKLKVKVTKPVSKIISASFNIPNPIRTLGDDLIITVDL
jgi:hypothetical protein